MAHAAWLQNNPNAPLPFEDDENDEQENDGPSATEPPAAKRVRLGYSDEAASGLTLRDPVLKLLRCATLRLPTEPMYREAVRFLARYLQQKEEERDNDGDDEGSAPFADEALSLLDALWGEARSSDFFASSTLVVEFVDYIVANGQNRDQATEVATQVLQDFVASNASSGAVPAQVWICLARLQAGSDASTSTTNHRTVPSDESVATLRNGLERTPTCQIDHLTLLVQLFGALLARAALKHQDELWLLLDRMLLLYPGFFSQIEDIPDAPFGVRNVPEACLEFQLYVANEEGLDGSRRLYEKLMFKSGLAELLERRPEDAHYVEEIVNQAVLAESKCAMSNERRENLVRIMDFALQHVYSTDSQERYRAARDKLRFRFVGNRSM
jgi:hypothetical protein